MQFMAALGPSMSVFVNIGLVVVIWAGGMQSIQNGVSVGQIVAFINYLQTTLGPLGIMVMLANVVAAASASSERLNEVLETVPDVQDIPDPLPLPATRQRKIEFSDVSFHYDQSTDGLVLKDIDLRVEGGKTVAILGATGSGKSTLVNLIPRFYDVTSGKVTVNGVDIRQVQRRMLLDRMGIVPQETVLFTGSVRDNIRYGRPQAEDDEVMACAKAAQAHDFIMKLPEGYDTRVEERGVNLSGGQKQRIAIARALMLRPSVLILDDSTSSVDVETETKIQDNFREWMRDGTIFVVAQRISTVLHADIILVLEQGKIVAQGTHSELMQTSPVYREIYDSQLGAGIKLEEEVGYEARS
jgi:ATP-binding cassette subfamily B protein